MSQQKLMLPPALMREPEEVDMRLIRACKSELDALRMQINMSGYSYEFVASQLSIDKGHMSRIMSGKAHFPVNKFNALNWLTGNLAFLQYLAWSAKKTLIKYELSPDERIAQLEEEIHRLKAG